MDTKILVLENEAIAFAMNADGSAEILDKRTAARWRMQATTFQDKSEIADDVVWIRNGRPYADYYPCRFRATKTGDSSIRVEVLRAPEMHTAGFFNCHISIEGGELVFRIEDIDEVFPSLVFPPPIVSESLVIPNGVGEWRRKSQPSLECRYLALNCGINMRWIGGLQADTRHGWIAILDDNAENAGFYNNNLSAPPVWTRSLGHWDKTRAVRYAFTADGYAGLAKIFRSYAQSHGLFKSIHEKIEENPTVANLLGGRIVSFFQSYTTHRALYEEKNMPLPADIDKTDGKVKVLISHAEAAEAIRDAKSWGMKKGVFCLRGTFAGGYDDQHPDIWPPEPALGSLDELATIIAQPDPYLGVLHDNYQDIYAGTKSFPQGVIQTRTGELMRGGAWHGGICHIMNTREALKYVKRNWQQLQSLSPRGHFIDTIACCQFYQDYHPDHTYTRPEDAVARHDIMRYYKGLPVVLGSENASDFGTAHLDYLENRQQVIPGETIPLWPLVYHDAAFYARYPSGGTSGGTPARNLENLLWGYMKYWPVNSLAEWKTQEAAFRESLYEDQWHARVGLDALTEHRFLDAEHFVEQTAFSSGASIIVNFADTPRTIEGRTIPAGGYAIIA